MANNCFYHCRIVGKNRENVRQFADAFKYKDFTRGYYLCRIFSADDDGIFEDGDYFCCDVTGDCAWSAHECMMDQSYGKWRGMDYGNPVFQVWRTGGEIRYSNIAVTIHMLCKLLDCGCEIWSKESGMGFQEHFLVNHEGETIQEEACKWVEGYDVDENGQWIKDNPEKDVGGWDEWGENEFASTIYSGEYVNADPDHESVPDDVSALHGRVDA